MGREQAPRRGARFNVTLPVVLVLSTLISLIGVDPLQMALFDSTIIALFLPISLAPLLIIMNDKDYPKEKANGGVTNIALVCILLLAFVAAVVSLPLLFLSGGG